MSEKNNQCCCHHDHEHDDKHNHEHCGCSEAIPPVDKTKIINWDLKLNIVGLDCPNCAMKVEKHLQQLPFVEDAQINFLDKVLKVKVKEGKKSHQIAQLQQAINEVESGVVISEEQLEEKSEIKSLIVSIVTFGISILLMHLWPKFSLWFCLIAYIVIAHKVLKTAIKNLLNGKVFDENFLMVIATLGAIYTQNYHEALAVMMFYEIGEFLQHKAVDSSTKSIKALVEIKSEFANVLVNGKKQQVAIDDVQIGDVIIVQNGERVPLDGVIIEGNTQLDTSAISGESLPVDVMENDKVISGSINLNELIKVRVTTLNKDSTVSKIMQLVEEASEHKSKSERFITKFAKVYTPIVVALAIIFLMTMVMINGWQSFDTYLNRACIFLVISCPCALVISIPLGIFAGIGKSSKLGVLVKGGNYLEQLADVDNIVLDKTGTVTNGNFQVSEYSNEQVLELATYGEFYSNHPLAKAIVSFSPYDVDENRLKNYQEIAGKGIKVLLDNKTLLIGNHKLMQEYAITTSDDYSIMVAYDGVYLGYLVVEDTIKQNSLETIEQLHQMNKKVYMLSGDQASIVEKVQQQLQIDEAYGGLLPQEKSDHLKNIIKQGRTAFVGDGINDAPSIMLADIGIAMGAIGSDAAIEASDIVIMNDDIFNLVSAIKVAKKTKKINYQNIIFALAIKVLVLITSAFGLTGMWLGVFADVGVTLIAIINALRILK